MLRADLLGYFGGITKKCVKTSTKAEKQNNSLNDDKANRQRQVLLRMIGENKQMID